MKFGLEELLIYQVTSKKRNGFNIWDRTKIEFKPKYIEKIEDVAEYVFNNYDDKNFRYILFVKTNLYFVFWDMYNLLKK